MVLTLSVIDANRLPSNNNSTRLYTFDKKRILIRIKKKKKKTLMAMLSIFGTIIQKYHFVYVVLFCHIRYNAILKCCIKFFHKLKHRT